MVQRVASFFVGDGGSCIVSNIVVAQLIGPAGFVEVFGIAW